MKAVKEVRKVFETWSVPF